MHFFDEFSVNHILFYFSFTADKMTLGLNNGQFQIALAVFFAIAMHQFCTSDVFTAMTDMEELLEAEAVLINNLEAYITAHEAKLNYLKR